MGGRGGGESGRRGNPPDLSPTPTLFPHPSSFAWLVTLFLAALLLRPFAPLTAAPWRLVPGIALLVAADTAALRGLWLADRALLRGLTAAAAAAPTPTLPPTVADATAMAACHGAAHGLTHAALLFGSWLPLAAGGRTLAPPHCPSVSLFAASAVTACFGVALHTGCAVIAFAGWDAGAPRVAARAPAAHAAFAAVSVLNLVGTIGCRVALPAMVVIAAAAAVEGGLVVWNLATADGGRVWARPVGGGGEDE